MSVIIERAFSKEREAPVNPKSYWHLFLYPRSRFHSTDLICHNRHDNEDERGITDTPSVETDIMELRKRQAFNLFSQGYTYVEISKKLDIHRTTVSKYVHEQIEDVWNKREELVQKTFALNEMTYSLMSEVIKEFRERYLTEKDSVEKRNILMAITTVGKNRLEAYNNKRAVEEVDSFKQRSWNLLSRQKKEDEEEEMRRMFEHPAKEDGPAA